MRGAGIFSNERVRASAGAGKTYALTNRFIALCTVCSPDEICALTFTRAAAAEFLDRILGKLAAASSDEHAAADLSSAINATAAVGDISRDGFARMLARVVSLLPRLETSTIDSFQLRFASAFASELGVAGDIGIMDDFEYGREKDRILKEVFALAASDKRTFESFIEAVGEAAGDTRSKRVYEDVSRYVETAYDFWRGNPNLPRWGEVRLLKPANFPLRRWNESAYESLCLKLEGELANLPEGDTLKFLKTLLEFFRKSRPGKIGLPSSNPVRTLARIASDGALAGASKSEQSAADLSEKIPEIMGSLGAVRVSNPKISSAQFSVLRDMVSLLIGGSILMSLDIAKSVGKICSLYDAAYTRDMRMRGRMTFSDIPALLSDPSSEFERSLVEYRLDAKYKHWLIDEFQDTSRRQWDTLGSLLGEVLQDESGGRTLYYVGDVKQSIYGWRGGDPDLFDEIFTRYRNVRDGAGLDTSWRSSKPVIDLVNSLFGSEKISGFGRAGMRWSAMWSEHKFLASKGENGCAMVVRRNPEEDPDCSKCVYEIIKKLDPENRGLSVGVLVRKNSQVREIVEGLRYLSRAEGRKLSVSGELDVGIAGGNMIVPAILSLLRGAAHPLDTAAKAYVEMTPLAFIAKGEGWRKSLLSQVSEMGFEKYFTEVFKRIESEGVALDDYSELVKSRFLAAAGEFDEAGRPDMDLFCDFLEKYSLRESSKSSCVRVMTIHKSKGLDFDVVIMPHNERGRGSAPQGIRLAEVKASDGGKLVVNMPSLGVCAFDKNLSEEAERISENLTLESLCGFYVGVTRAKYAVYFIVDEDAEKGRGKYSFEKHILSVLNLKKSDCFPLESAVAFGSGLWFEKVSAKFLHKAKRSISVLDNPTLISIPKLMPVPSRAGLSLPRDALAPALCKNGKMELFNANPALYGSVVHSIFENLPFVSSDPCADVEKASLGIRAPKAWLCKAKSGVLRCLSNVKILEIFTRVEGLEIRKEYPFVLCVDGGTCAGVFDRMNIYRDGFGRVQKVKIVDFKTGAPESAADFIRENSVQMRMYGEAAAELFPQSPVEIALVDVDGARIVEVPWESL